MPAGEAAARIGWQAHTVAKRCENIRNRYVRLGVPGLRGPRALEELAQLLVSTGELTPPTCGGCRTAPDQHLRGWASLAAEVAVGAPYPGHW